VLYAHLYFYSSKQNHSPNKLKERVELYLYSPYGPLRSVLGDLYLDFIIFSPLLTKKKASSIIFFSYRRTGNTFHERIQTADMIYSQRV
jgi:hypothetical protein